MTRRRLIFFNDLSNEYIVSDEYNGDKAEMERFGLGSCDCNWADFVQAMREVKDLVGFLKVMSMITDSYHSTINGELLPEEDKMPGTRLNIVRSTKELYGIVETADEVWEIRRGTPGAHLMDLSEIRPQTFNGKDVTGVRDFSYSNAKPGDYVTQGVVDDAMDCMPPACMSARCSQMGEPYSRKLDEKTGLWRDTYATFRKVGGEWPNGIWEYCGHCFRGETEEHGKEMQTVSFL